MLLDSVILFYAYNCIAVLFSTRQCTYNTACYSISKGISLLLLIADYYLKETCNSVLCIIKFK